MTPSRCLLEFLKIRGDIDVVVLDEWQLHPADVAERKNGSSEEHLGDCSNLRELCGIWVSLHGGCCDDKCTDNTTQ